jgi:MoaA/NifB/PqqE/SkfB family radical SAM enzyme
MPHLGLAVQNYGDVCACNINKQSYGLDGNRYTVDQGPIDAVWASPTRQELIQDLDSGQQHPSCKACWDAELAKKHSARQHMNATFGHLTPEPDQPRIVIVKPGNTCNAACRMCNPATSSSWYQDDYKRKKLKNSNLDFKLYIKDFETVRNSFHPDNQNFWPVMEQWYKKLEMIDIYGGEPWLIDGVWTGLRKAVEQGHSKHIDIQIHTNLSVWNPDYLDILSNFRSINIGMSIDSHLKSQFEYIRHKLDFEQCMSNAEKFVKYSETHPNINIQITVSPSVLNIGNLDDIYQNLSQRFGVDVGITNFVTSPDEYYDIRHLPLAIKRQLSNQFSKQNQQTPILNVVTAFMNQTIPGCDMYWPKFCMETDRLDQIRNQNFRTAMPEWSAVLEPYWDYTKQHREWFCSPQ